MIYIYINRAQTHIIIWILKQTKDHFNKKKKKDGGIKNIPSFEHTDLLLLLRRSLRVLRWRITLSRVSLSISRRRITGGRITSGRISVLRRIPFSARIQERAKIKPAETIQTELERRSITLGRRSTNWILLLIIHLSSSFEFFELFFFLLFSLFLSFLYIV